MNIPFILEKALQLYANKEAVVCENKRFTYKQFADRIDVLAGQLTKKGITAGYEVRTGSPAEQIIDLADEFASDMVAMSTRGQTAINIWSLGSVAQKVLLGGNTPLLLIKA